jgi:hypothetical protein
MTKAKLSGGAFANATKIEIHSAEFPTRECIEIGAGSEASFAADSHGINSGDHNKSAEEILASYRANRKSILKAVNASVKQELKARLG